MGKRAAASFSEMRPSVSNCSWPAQVRWTHYSELTVDADGLNLRCAGATRDSEPRSGVPSQRWWSEAAKVLRCSWVGSGDCGQ